MDSAGRGQEDKVHVAKHVYLLMKKEYRISRNIRALWYLQHLNHVLHYRPRQTLEDVTEELTVLSVLPCDETVSVELGKEYRFLITPDTIITFISRRYRLVFALDLSPSSASVDLCSGEVLFDEVLTRLQNCLLGLVQPLTLPGSFLVLNPQIYVTVIASTPLLTCSTNHVITQGMLITRDNIHVFIREARSKLMQFEATLVQNFSKVLRSEDYMSDGIGLTGGLFVDIVEPTSSPVPPDILVSPEPCFVNMLKYGILALQLLPENTSAGIIVITDGMVGLPNASVFETLMIQLRNGTIACSFLRLGSSRNDSCQLGHVPHVELLQFIATATFGAYFSTCPVLTECEPSMNVYHQAFFCWNFQKGLDGFKIEDLSCKNPGELTEDLAWENSPCVPPSRQGLKWQNLSPVVRKKHGETTLHTSISSVMSLRLREGYTIKEIQVTKGESQLMVTLVLPWRDFVRIEYVASTNWPLDDTNLVTHTEIILEGSYEFLHDVTCPHKQPLRSVYRTAVVKKFWQTLQGIQQTDQLLVHLQSFSSNLDYYNIPDSIKNGVPLFFVQSSSSMPCLSLQHSSKDTALSQFAAFWKPVFNLDTNIWQKWMHTHRIGIILEHDTPLPKYLHIPNSSRRFNSIQCRQALSSLNGMLRDWSSFVLVENLSYINLLQPDPDKPPTSFCLLRVSSKPPCMVLRLAFLGGTPGAERHEFTRDLRDRVRALKFPQRGTQKADKPRRKEVQSELSESTERAELTKIRRKPPLLREWAEIHCCVLVTKPVEKILIRYERIPREMMNIDDPGHDAQGMSPHHAPPNPLASIFTVLSRYLYHKRWVWSVQHSSSTPLSMTAINKILSTLSKIRLQEGFHFAMSNIGIVTMVLEVDMMRAGRDNNEGAENADELGSCIIQYVIFPPYTKTTRGSVSEDDLDEMETTEADGELQIVTECWVEPQSGVVLNSTPERLYMEGLNYRQIPQQFYPLDLECISCLITFQHLVTVCQCFNLTAPDSQLPIYASTLPESLSTGRPHRPTDKDCEDNEPPVKHTPFPFDLLTLLPRCQQAELLFSTYWSGDDLGNQQSVNNLLFDLLYQKFKLHHDKEVILSPNDCLNFVRLVTERKRDVEAQPYPFRFADLLAAAPENVVIESVVIRDEEGAPDCGPSEASSVSDARDGEKESCASSKDRSTVGPDKTESSAGLAGVLGTPNWNCLVKVDTTNHLILTFLPATYDDLALLNLLCLDGKGPQSSATESHKERPHVVEETGAPSCVAKEDGDTEELSPLPVDAVSDDARDGSTGDDLHSEFSLSSGKNPTSPLTKQQPSTKIRIEQSPGENVPQVPKFPIPVYVYDCYLSNLSNSLVDRWNFELSEDIFEDLTFPSDMDISGAVPLSPRVRMASHEMETMPDFEREENTDTVKDRWRQSLDRRSTDSVSDFHGALWQHCVVLGEDYFTSYVTGIFKNLQVGHSVSKEDVESAINSICEEALPLEADMTCFLETSCGHLLQQIERSKVEGIAPADNLDSGDGKAVVRFADIPGDVEGTGIMEESGETSRSTTVPEVLLFPTGSSINIHIADLHLSTPCESPKGLHELIKTKFSDIVKLWFKPIPSYPDYYFYSPENGMDISTHQDFSDTAGAESDFQPAEMGGIPEEYSDYFMSDYEEAGPMEKAPSIRSEGEFSTMSNKGSVSPAPSGSSAVEDDLDSFNEVENARNQPLFLHFTCTLKSKTFHHNVSLQLLPTCLVDLTKYLEGLTDIDLGDMKVTFDLNCLTLPTDADYSSLSRRPKYVRMSSHTSASPPQSDVEGEDAVSTTTSHDAFQFRGIDPISHLPKFQKRAVENCKKEIEWLLRDELTSSLRHIYPVTVANLQLVADHVKASPGKPTCVTESIPIKFVFGQEQSLPKFIQELERLNLKGYRIMKEDQYYFIVVDRARPRNWAHAYELNSKLVELSRECSPAKEVHRFSTESDTAPPINEKLDKEPEANQIVSSPDAVFLADDVSTAKGDDPHDHLSRCLTAIGFTSVASGSRSSESPEVRRSEPSPKSVALLFDSVDKIDKNSLQGSDQQIPTTIKSSMSMVNVQPRTSYPTVTAPSPEENVVLKRSSSFSGFTMEEQFTPLTTTPEKSALGTDPSNSVLKSVASAPHMVLHNRVKHFSGPSGTTTTPLSRTSTRPQTPSWVSSTGSYTEGGYEGGSSDPEDDDEVRSHTGVTVHSPLYITFWLLIQVHQDKVDVFYHTRDTKSPDDQEAVYQKEVLDRVLELIKSYCRIVNQHMLMLDLYETRMCNPLLVPEADEDVTWRRDSVTKHKQLPAGADIDDEDEDGTQGQVCLMDNLKLKPGFFACDPVLKHHFLLHPRIKTGPSRSSGISRGVQVLRARLNTFSVNNRKNMFVIRESTTENVFYLRLQDMEMCDGSFTEGGAGSCKDNEDAVSASSSLRSMNRRGTDVSLVNKTNPDGEDSETTSGEKEADALSVGSSGIMRLDSRHEECIELSVHGITTPGPEIRDLIQILQKRLDDAVLDIIALMLFRNPMCKLTADDVHFIQQPDQEPSRELLLTVPSSASLQLFALMYYLRQNLKQFLTVPNYTDTRGDNHFQDQAGGQGTAIPEGSCFLYNTPQGAGSKGIACVSLSLVDGQKNLKRLVGCCKPSRSAYREWMDIADMQRQITTEEYTPGEATGPGPQALIRFRMWARGTVHLDTLTRKLREAVTHALCDIVMEYRLLTTPICEPPNEQTLEEELRAILLSEPLSPPRAVLEGKEKERRLSGVKGMEQSRSPGKSAGPASPFQTIFSDFRKRTRSPSAKESPKTFDFSAGVAVPKPTVAGDSSAQEAQELSQPDADIRALAQRYEAGERGQLQAKYWSNIIQWLDFCSANGCPSVQKSESSVLSRFSVDMVLRELQNSVKQVTSDAKPVVYRLTECAAGVTSPVGVPHNVNRQPVVPSDPSNESSTDLSGGQLTCLSQSNNYLMIGRNFEQWQSSLEMDTVEEQAESGPSGSGGGPKKYVKFQPYDISQGLEKLPVEVDINPESTETFFVPRQRLLIVTVKEKQFCMYTYNWTGDLTSTLTRLFSRLVQWHGARSHLLNNLLHQKMGLFHHHTLTEPPQAQSSNCFIQQNMEIELLIQSTTPPSREPQRRQTNSMQPGSSGSGAFVRHFRPFEKSFYGLRPPKPLHRSSYGNNRDPVTRHGMQTKDIKYHERKDTERAVKLQKLYHEWHGRPGSTIPIAEDYLVLLKQSARLVHYCATPLLLSPRWRHKAMARPDMERPHSVPVTSSTVDKIDTKSQRSRHSSGASNTSLKNRRTDSQEDKRKSAPTPTSEAPDFRPRGEVIEEAWHIELRRSFLSQYIQYLQSLGFMQVQTRPNSPRRGGSRSTAKRSEDKVEEEERGKKRSMLTCLQKTLPGGILLMELNYRDVYFCVKLFAHDCMQLPLGVTVNSQLRLLFVDECDKYRDLIHVHSFAHDFHLRCIQSYIQGRQYEFKQGYHLAGFLSDFYQIHPSPPSFARNYLSESTLSFHNINTSGEQLYSYMVEHAKLYDMKALKMMISASDLEPDYEVVRETEQALVCQNFDRIVEDADLRHQLEDFDVGLAIVAEGHTMLQELEQLVDRSTLRLRYYIIMTSRRDLFPKSHLGRRLSLFKSAAAKQQASEKTFVIVSGSPLPYSESMTDLSGLSSGSDAAHTLPIRPHYLVQADPETQPVIALLQKEVAAAEAKIKGMVESSITLCRRDVLWQRLILGGEGVEEESRRKKRSDTEDSKTIYKLTFSEFSELLGMVTKWPLRNLDDRLLAMESMSLPWYHSLAQLLVAKNPQNHRQFVSPDGAVQYVVLINPWQNPPKLENFMLLHVDNQGHRAELCAVFQEVVLDNDHSAHILGLPSVQTYVESFVSTCCFHLWSSMLAM